MAHNLELRNGTYSFAECTKKEIAWHKLGQNHTKYGSKGVEDDAERKFDNVMGGSVHSKLMDAYCEIVA